MSQGKTAPGWGKAVGILMIVFGGLGVFIQIYKIMMPQILRMQKNMMHSFSTIEMDNQPNPFRHSQNIFSDMMGISDLQANTLIISGVIGLIGCIFYIIGGAKLLRATPANFKFAKTVLIGFLSLNVLTVILLISEGSSLMMLAILVYIIMGLVVDLVLTIIVSTSNKTAYGIGVAESDAVDSYTRDNEII